MIRSLALSLAAVIALLTATLNGAAETFPVVHNEPITVRILGGKDGQPLAQLHLVLLAGYDQSDLHDQLYRAELLTDAHGQAHLPKQFANLPWLQVWVDKKPLCQSKPRGESFSVELIRRDGLSAPNRCGTAVVEDAPGVFTVFVKSKEKNAPAVTLVARAEAPAPVTVATALPAVVAPARKPAEAETHPPVAQIPAVPAAAALQEKPALAPAVKPTEPARKPAEVETRPSAAQIPAVPAATALQEKPAPAPAVKPAEAARPVAAAPAAVPKPAAVVVIAAAPAVVATSRRASDLARAAAYRRARQVAMRPVSHRARPVLASCEMRKPHAKAEPPAASSPRSEDKPDTVLDAAHKSKPAAGVRLEAVTPGESKAPPK
jgi:hypothetical protein